jgi:UPF0042 nucleotide-binding protein
MGESQVSTLVLTGLTGSGKSLVAQQLETLGFRSVDALPPSLISVVWEKLSPESPAQNHHRLALVLDLTQRSFFEQLPLFWHWQEKGQINVLFLEADQPTLLRRLSTHRRSHPFLSPEVPGLEEAIHLERSLLRDVRLRSTHLLDTSPLSIQGIRQYLTGLIFQQRPPLQITLVSFGFKYGVPTDANLLFDVRFLLNPYYIPDLRLMTGQDPILQEYLFQDPLTQSTYYPILNTLTQLLPAYWAEGRPHLTVAIGCTGGQHRSVAVVEKLRQDLEEFLTQSAIPDGHTSYVTVSHRHLQRSQQELAQLFEAPSALPAVRT